jgi:hypothetical protein
VQLLHPVGPVIHSLAADGHGVRRLHLVSLPSAPGCPAAVSLPPSPGN